MINISEVLQGKNILKVYKVYGHNGEYVDKYWLDETGVLRSVSDSEILEERFQLWDIVNLFKFKECE
ncbi:hypothetical protein [Clostridium sp.]|uniref:hypothetical protein n=1 Tax=Clostridium sp. TaxID=1506 RepID=UPI003217E44D